MAELREELGRAPRSSRTYTVAEAASAWLDDGLPGRSERTKTICKAAEGSRWYGYIVLSSSWVEGSKCELAAFGHSGDGKRGRRQVEYGLLTDPAGHPVAVEVFPENSDPESFKTAITRVRTDFGIERLVLRELNVVERYRAALSGIPVIEVAERYGVAQGSLTIPCPWQLLPSRQRSPLPSIRQCQHRLPTPAGTADQPALASAQDAPPAPGSDRCSSASRTALPHRHATAAR